LATDAAAPWGLLDVRTSSAMSTRCGTSALTHLAQSITPAKRRWAVSRVIGAVVGNVNCAGQTHMSAANNC